MTDKPSLYGCKAKLERAEQNIINLASEIKSLMAEDVNGRIPSHDGDVFEDTVKPFVSQNVPPRLSVLVGECIHNLRSCLDQSVWQLILANGRTPSEQTCFPIYTFNPATSSDKRALKRYCGAIEGVSPAVKTIIDGLQPHIPRNGGHGNALAIIHALNIADKHHDLLTIRRVACRESYTTSEKTVAVPSGNPVYDFSEIDENGTKTVFHYGGESPVYVNSKVTQQITLIHSGADALEPVIEALWQLWWAVRYVVADFELYFE